MEAGRARPGSVVGQALQAAGTATTWSGCFFRTPPRGLCASRPSCCRTADVAAPAACRACRCRLLPRLRWVALKPPSFCSSSQLFAEIVAHPVMPPASPQAARNSGGSIGDQCIARLQATPSDNFRKQSHALFGSPSSMTQTPVREAETLYQTTWCGSCPASGDRKIFQARKPQDRRQRVDMQRVAIQI